MTEQTYLQTLLVLEESICTTAAEDLMKAFPLIWVENTVIAVRHGILFYSFWLNSQKLGLLEP